MKVLQIVNNYMGTKLYSLLFQSLYKCGVENEIFVPIKYSDCSENCVYNQINEGNVVVSPCFNTIDRLVFFWKQENILKQIIKLIELHKISIIHAHTLFSSGYAAMKLKEEYEIPYIVAVRNVDVNVFFKIMKWMKNTGIRIMKNASRIVFLSPAYKNFVCKNYVPTEIRDEIEKKSIVIPNGIAELFLKHKANIKKLNNGNIQLLYVGEINMNKNLITTIKAVRFLRKQGVAVSIVCVGDVTEKSCSKWIEDETVTHHAKCTQEELLHYYREADIFVMPSHTETFGLVYAEAMSQGLPVIYSRGQGFDGYFPDGEVGYAVDSNNEREIVERIIDICKNYKMISENCICNVDMFDWSIVANRYKDLYSELIQDVLS